MRFFPSSPFSFLLSPFPFLLSPFSSPHISFRPFQDHDKSAFMTGAIFGLSGILFEQSSSAWPRVSQSVWVELSKQFWVEKSILPHKFPQRIPECLSFIKTITRSRSLRGVRCNISKLPVPKRSRGCFEQFPLWDREQSNPYFPKL